MPLSPASHHFPRIVAFAFVTVLFGAVSALLGLCGPFTDVAADTFCPFVLEIFTVGITTGTTPTTYDPTSSVSRLQMAAFLSRSVDAALKRGSRRAALGDFATPQDGTALGLTTVGAQPQLVKSDGADIWVEISPGTRSPASVRATAAWRKPGRERIRPTESSSRWTVSS